MASDIQSKLGRLAAKPGAGPITGSTEHALVILVLIELGLLIALRKHFRSAHGG